VNLAIAGKHRYEGKTKPLYRLREALKHPAIWSGVAIAAKALHFAPGVGGVLAGIRKHNWAADDLKRMEVERLHGHTGKMDAYRQELSQTFGGMYTAEELIDTFQFNLSEINAVNDPLKMRPGAINSLVEGLGTVQAINQHGYKAISDSPG